MMTKQESLAAKLADFNEAPGVRGSAIVTRDGLPLISSLPHGINPETFAAMVATTVGAAETAASEIDPSPASRLDVAFERVRLVAADAGPELVVVALLDVAADPHGIDAALEVVIGEVRQLL